MTAVGLVKAARTEAAGGVAGTPMLAAAMLLAVARLKD